MTRRRCAITGVLLAVLLTVSTAGCASSGSAAPDDGRIRIVASTEVYGSIAESIGGDRVNVTSIIDAPGMDPHSYEADARVQLALARADLVIENGGGYDDFMATLLDGARNPDATVINVTDLSGYGRDEAFNEHLWYDFPTMVTLVDELVAALSERDAASSDAYRSAGDDLVNSLNGLMARESALKSAHEGKGVAITEPVPLYLLEASGLVDRTPPAFSEAIEEGTDVAPAVLRETLDLFAGRAVSLLAYNDQTTGPETEKVKAAAADAGIPVVGVAETLPEGVGYVDWMTSILVAVETALS